LLVGDGVLDDHGAHPLGMGERQTEPDRAAVVLQVETVSRDPLLLQESVDDLGEVIERVVKRARRRRVAPPEPGIIRRDEIEPVRQARDQVAEHHRRRGESVQEDESRVTRVAGLSVENRQPVDLRRPVSNGREIVGVSYHGRSYLPPLRRRLANPRFWAAQMLQCGARVRAPSRRGDL